MKSLRQRRYSPYGSANVGSVIDASFLKDQAGQSSVQNNADTLGTGTNKRKDDHDQNSNASTS